MLHTGTWHLYGNRQSSAGQRLLFTLFSARFADLCVYGGRAAYGTRVKPHWTSHTVLSLPAKKPNPGQGKYHHLTELCQCEAAFLPSWEAVQWDSCGEAEDIACWCYWAWRGCRVICSSSSPSFALLRLLGNVSDVNQSSFPSSYGLNGQIQKKEHVWQHISQCSARSGL